MSDLVEMVLIPTGEFMMGALPDDENARDDEKPRHKVEITKDFYVGKYPVTQKLYLEVMGYNYSNFEGEDRPVDNVSWFECVEFCNKLSELEGKEPVYTINGENVTCNWHAKGYRLLTEAEWEYCARGGEEHLYAGSDTIAQVAWYSDNSSGATHPVGDKQKNGFGLYDMSGNIWELCWDAALYDHEFNHVDSSVYTMNPRKDPGVHRAAPVRMVRGGSWENGPGGCRSSFRDEDYSSNFGENLGFRFVRDTVSSIGS